MFYFTLLTTHILAGIATFGLCAHGVNNVFQTSSAQSLLKSSQNILVSVVMVMISGLGLLWLQLHSGSAQGACTKLALYLTLITATEALIATKYLQLTKPATLLLPFRTEGLTLLSSWLAIVSIAQVVGW
jgi:hypothetical protein